MGRDIDVGVVDVWEEHPFFDREGRLDQQFFVVVRRNEVVTKTIPVEVKVLRLGIHPSVASLVALLRAKVGLTLGVATHDLALAGVGVVDGPQDQLTLIALVLRTGRGATHVADCRQQDR